MIKNKGNLIKNYADKSRFLKGFAFFNYHIDSFISFSQKSHIKILDIIL